jgi:hypothetical protein
VRLSGPGHYFARVGLGEAQAHALRCDREHGRSLKFIGMAAAYLFLQRCRRGAIVRALVNIRKLYR